MKTIATKIAAATLGWLFAIGAAQAGIVDSILAQADSGKIYQLTIDHANGTVAETEFGSFPDVGPKSPEPNSPNGLAVVNGEIYRAAFNYTEPGGTQQVFKGPNTSVFTTVDTERSAIAAAGGFGDRYYYADSIGNVRSVNTTDVSDQTDFGSVTSGSRTFYGDLVVQDAQTLILTYDEGAQTTPHFGALTRTGSKGYEFKDSSGDPITPLKWAGIAFGQSGTLYGVRAKNLNLSDADKINEGAGDTGVYKISFAHRLETVSYALIGTLDNSTVKYTDASPLPTPIPAAAWLFGSALLGAVGLGRRKVARASKA